MRYCGAPGSVGSLMRYFALPADMAPHIPDNVSWEESGSIQPLAVSNSATRATNTQADNRSVCKLERGLIFVLIKL